MDMPLASKLIINIKTLNILIIGILTASMLVIRL